MVTLTDPINRKLFRFVITENVLDEQQLRSVNVNEAGFMHQ